MSRRETKETKDRQEAYQQGVGDSIRRLCGLFLVSQAQLADEADVSPHQMSALVKGKVAGRSSTYVRIFDVFGLTPFEDFAAELPRILEQFGEIEERVRTRFPSKGQ